MLSKLINKILYIEDPADGRKWRRSLTFERYKGRFYFGYSLYLIRYDNEPCNTLVKYFYINLIYKPKYWYFGQEHLYYDGPHCFYGFGPISITKSLDWSCPKCMSE